MLFSSPWSWWITLLQLRGICTRRNRRNFHRCAFPDRHERADNVLQHIRHHTHYHHSSTNTPRTQARARHHHPNHAHHHHHQRHTTTTNKCKEPQASNREPRATDSSLTSMGVRSLCITFLAVRLPMPVKNVPKVMNSVHVRSIGMKLLCEGGCLHAANREITQRSTKHNFQQPWIVSSGGGAFCDQARGSRGAQGCC